MKAAKDSIDIGIVVKDIGASLRFYRDELGLEYAGQNPIPAGTLHRLRFGTSDIKLVDPKTVPSAGPEGLDAQLGYRYLTFAVANLSQLCAALKGHGVPFAVPETELRPGVRIAMAKDPDGNIVEFVER
ncbi:MAG: VOC family protein [Treponemataceae bacterium]